MDLTSAQRNLLEQIGRQGATRGKLGPLADAHELQELIRARLVTYEPIAVRETQPAERAHMAPDQVDVWYLTEAGATAVGIDPRYLRGA